MRERIWKKYLPMTETAYYILLSLRTPLHGYGVILKVEEMTKGRIRIGPGTIYGTLTKLEKDGLIETVGIDERRKIYKQTAEGESLLQEELKRLKELLDNGRSCYHD